jgi:hypothetical protein
VGSGIPYAERPSALRIMVSKWSNAAMVAGDAVADSTANSVAADGRGGGKCVARNMW